MLFDAVAEFPLARRATTLTITTDIAIVTRTIRTPWPVVLGLWVLSLILGFISTARTKIETARWAKLRRDREQPNLYVAALPAPDNDESRKPSGQEFRISKLTAAVWIVNFVRAFVALVYLIIDLVHGQIPLPSNGVAIGFATLLANAMHVYDGKIALWSGRISYVLAVVGLGLYVAVGIEAARHTPNRTIQVLVAESCQGYLFRANATGPLLCP